MKGSELRKAREALGLSAVQLAKKIGKHPVSISRFEHGHEPVPLYMTFVIKGLECDHNHRKPVAQTSSVSKKARKK